MPEGELQVGASFDYVDAPQFTVLPEGDYDAVIMGYELKRYTPSAGAKLTACNMAKVRIQIQNEAGQVNQMTETLFLHSKCMGILSAFFKSVEKVDPNGKFVLDFSQAVGKRCRVHVKAETYTKNNGDSGEANRVTRWLPPPYPGYSFIQDQQQPVQQTYAQPAYTQQSFAQPQAYAQPSAQPTGWSGGGFR